MYGINTEYHIPYIDCLFLCVTSMTVNGLATVDLSTLSTMQQVIMFWQMLIGSLVGRSVPVVHSDQVQTRRLMVGFRVDCDDYRATVFLQVEIQACHPGATTTITTSENDLSGRYYPYPTSQRNQETF